MHYSVYRRLNVTVYDTNRTVLRKLWQMIKRKDRRRRDKRTARHALYRGVLKCHDDALKIVRQYRL